MHSIQIVLGSLLELLWLQRRSRESAVDRFWLWFQAVYIAVPLLLQLLLLMLLLLLLLLLLLSLLRILFEWGGDHESYKSLVRVNKSLASHKDITRRANWIGRA